MMVSPVLQPSTIHCILFLLIKMRFSFLLLRVFFCCSFIVAFLKTNKNQLPVGMSAERRLTVRNIETVIIKKKRRPV